MQFKRRLLLCIVLTVAVNFIVLYIIRKNNPMILTGPSYVEGWYQNTSKNVKDYVSENLVPHILPKKFCDENFQLLLIVHSKIDNVKARQIIRETWGQKGANFSLYFLVGEDNHHNYELKLRLIDESEKYNDIIQERFVDSYNNLTLKSVNMLKLFHLYCAKSYKYLMKIDDDVYFLAHNFLHNLPSLNSTNLLIGKLITDTQPIRDPDSKWYVPCSLYPQQQYPPYLCGPAYVMSRDVAEKLYFCTLDTPVFFIEDVFITGICAQKVNVTPIYDHKFTCLPLKKYICPYRDLYTLHYYTPEEMMESYNMLKYDSCPPFKSFWEWLFTLLR